MLTQRDLELLYEVGSLRFITRAWSQVLRNRNVANLAEHMFRVAWIAMTIAKHEGADLGDVAKMALMHDMSESRTGDAHYMSRLYIQRDENKAVNDIFNGSILSDDMFVLWNEYEKCETLASKCVKDADWLDVDFELSELYETGEKIGDKDLWYRELVREKLKTETGKKMWAEIYNGDSHSWHRNSTHMFNSGYFKSSSE
jgi:putative hydrolase of HD superfamily